MAGGLADLQAPQVGRDRMGGRDSRIAGDDVGAADENSQVPLTNPRDLLAPHTATQRKERKAASKDRRDLGFFR